MASNTKQCLRLKWRSNRHTPQNTRGCNVRSKIRWLTEFCNSHYLSHFAAFFIDARTKRSVVESFDYCIVLRQHNKSLRGPLAGTDQPKPVVIRRARQSNKGIVNRGWEITLEGHVLCNDPSAGSTFQCSSLELLLDHILTPLKEPPLFDLWTWLAQAASITFSDS